MPKLIIVNSWEPWIREVLPLKLERTYKSRGPSCVVSSLIFCRDPETRDDGEKMNQGCGYDLEISSGSVQRLASYKLMGGAWP